MQAGAGALLHPSQEREREIGFNMPLVEFVENNHTDVGRQAAAQQTSREDAFGEKPQPSAVGAGVIEAHLIPDSLAQLFAEFLRDAFSSHARGDAPWFQYPDLAGLAGQKSRRNTRSLARSRFGFEENERVPADGLGDTREKLVDR